VRKILIFWNSASGKSTVAKKIAMQETLAHLDLDVLAWLAELPPKRASLEDSTLKIKDFMSLNSGWVIEGGYSDLLELACSQANEIIFMDLSVSQCVENAKNRPWERHKYDSKEMQDSNLDMLLDWIKLYVVRDDVFSYSAHIRFYEKFDGKKSKVTKNDA